MTDQQARKEGIKGELLYLYLVISLINMSRIGKQSIDIPEKVKVKLDGQKILVDGPREPYEFFHL